MTPSALSSVGFYGGSQAGYSIVNFCLMYTIGAFIKQMNKLMMVSWYSPREEEMSAGIFHYEQSIALQKYCNVALYYPNDPMKSCKLSKNTEKGLLTYRSYGSKFKFLKCFRIFSSFCKIKKDFAPDLIHAHVAFGAAGMFAIALGKLFRIPVIVTEHNPIELINFDNFFVRKMIQWVYHNSKANICVSTDLKNKLEKIYPKETFQVIYNGIINPKFIERDRQIYAKEGYVNCCIVAAFYDKDINIYYRQ